MKFGRFLLLYYRYAPRQVLGVGLLGLCAAAMEGFSMMLLIPLLVLAGVGQDNGSLPSSLGWLREALQPVPPDHRLLAILGGFVMMLGTQALLGAWRDRRSQALLMAFVDHLRVDYLRALALCRWNHLNLRHSGENLSVLLNDVERVGAGVHALVYFVTSLLMALSYLVVATQISLPLTALSFGMGISLWFLLRRSRQTAQASGETLSQAYEAVQVQMQEFVNALKLIKIHGEEQSAIQQYGHLLSSVRQQQNDFLRIHSNVDVVYRLGGALSLAVVAYLALTYSGLAPAGLLVLIAIFSRLLPQLSAIQSGAAQLSNMYPALENWQSRLLTLQAHQESQMLASVLPLREALRVERLQYRHPTSHRGIQVDHLTIPAFTTTAIIGESGSGKTTLLDVLSGLNAPDSGTIYADKTPLPAHSRAWRQGLAYIPQESVILDGSVRDNLLWGAPAQDDAALEQALRQAACGFLTHLPQGLDTQVGEKGLRLSGGERQRLALARALLRHPQLLILDEATNALDAENQRNILEAIAHLHGTMTILIVTHRHGEFQDLVDGQIKVDSGVVSAWQACPKTGAP